MILRALADAARSRAIRASRFFRWEITVGLGLGVLVLAGVGVICLITDRHAARAMATRACAVALEEAKRARPILQRAVLPADPCGALRLVRGEW